MRDQKTTAARFGTNELGRKGTYPGSTTSPPAVLAKTLRTGLVLAALAAVGSLAAPASPAAAAETCPNEQLRAEDLSAKLPECRAYEQVSPAGPFSVEFNGISPDGNTAFFASGGPVMGLPVDTNVGASGTRMFGATRMAGGWAISSSTSFALPLHHTYPFVGSTAEGAGMFVTSATLETPPDVFPPVFALNLYEVSPGLPPLLISHQENGQALSDESQTGFRGPIVTSADGAHVVFSTELPLAAAAVASGGGPYLYEADAAGRISLVSVKSNGELPPPGGGAGLGGTKPGELSGSELVANAISADGSTIFFNSAEEYAPTAGGQGTQIFMRRAGATLDASAGVENASFEGASSDGNIMVFHDGSNNLYEFDAATDSVVPIASGAGGADTYLAMSGDGSHVYFASNLRLDPSVPPYESSDPFLYQWANGVVTYIATLSERDVHRLTTPTTTRPDDAGREVDVTGTDATGPIRATADGAHLVFESERRLTQDDNNEEPERTNVYEFTEDAGLVRVSAGSLVGSGNGPYSATIGSAQQSPDFAHGTGGEEHPFTYGTSESDGRVLTEAGAVFFSSREALAQGATDGSLHVYEWREGDTSLISPAGSEATDAQYLENSPDGVNVYFSTTQEVLPSDTNGGWVNIWDARIGGGFPGAPPANPCAENECVVSAPIARPTPSSMTFSGPGNVTPVPPAATTQSSAATKLKPVTRAEELAKRLKTCKKKKNSRERVACERTARRKVVVPKAKKATKQGDRS